MDIFAIVAISILGFILFYLGFIIAVGVSSFYFSMSAKSMAKKLAKMNTEKNNALYKIDHDWWDKQKTQTLTITSTDNLKLYGHFIEKSKDKLAILVHGYGGVYKDLNSYADMFLKRGYSVLAVECRAHGQSEGSMVGMGWLDKDDIKLWIDFIVEKYPDSKIVLFGQSMGASAVCMTLGEKLPRNVICAISDCAFDNVYRQFYHVCRSHLRFMSKPTLNIFNNYLKRTRDYDMKRADAVKQLKKSSLPVLFIHGKADDFVPVEMCYRLSEAIPESRRDMLLVEGAGHIQSYAVDTKAYLKAVDKFLKKYNM